MNQIVLKGSVAALVVGLLACGSAGNVQPNGVNPSPPSASEGPEPDGGVPNAGVHDDAGVTPTGTGSGRRACPVLPSTDPLVVASDKGLVKGKRAGTAFEFLGIPFATPPVGALRLMPPVPPACWTDVKDATNYGNMCVQTPGALNNTTVTGSEDCLTVNVWTPALPSSSNESLPVLVWIYGGGEMIGGSNMPGPQGQNVYSGQALATAQDAVVVSFNYRVGALGFLAHPALAANNRQHTTGNYGLLDALLALRWVQDNIASFNGDPKRVMIFGQSAGAINTCALVSSPMARGLFSSALMESGNCAAESLSYRYQNQASVLAAANCSSATNTVQCLQSAPLSAFVESGGNLFFSSFVSMYALNIEPAQIMNLPFGPTVDNYVLDDVPEATIKAGRHNRVPLVIGTNAQEMDFLFPQSLFPMPSGLASATSCAEFAGMVNVMFPGNTHPGVPLKLLQAYPCNPLDQGNAGYRAFIAMTTDGFFACPSRRALRAAAHTQTEPVYRYFWTHTDSSGSWAYLGAGHGTEVSFVWGDFSWLWMAPTPAETTLSQQMQAYWTNFAASGNPNGGNLPIWKKYDPAFDTALQFDTPITDTWGIDSAACDVWDSLQ
jgi:para-nitrobenzyl esterase